MATPEPAAGALTSVEPNPDPPDESVGSRLRDARRAVGLTQQKVADKLDVSRRAVSEWETNVRQPYSALPGLSALYGVSTSFLLYGVETASVELRELREYVSDCLSTISGEIKQTRADLVALAETVERTFAEQRLILEALAREYRLPRSEAPGSAETPPDDPRDDRERHGDEA